tara:strand:- start:160 stop:468 length:309 start_codon:yes stop_codon:yes gene_type:complete
MTINKVRKFDAILSLKPNAKFTVRGNETIEWLDDTETQPNDTEIQNEIDRLQAEYDALEYQRKRKAEYPTIEELVVALYDTDDKAAIDAKRAAVKAKYPKGS